MKVCQKIICLSVFCALMTHQAYGQVDEPVDRNFPGPTIGLNLNFGQAQKAGGSSSPGAYWNVAGELGYVVKRDTWKRIELGLELGTGGLEFRDKNQFGSSNVDIDLKSYAMFKAGYGYSLGGQAFGVWRLGAGMAFADAEAGSGLLRGSDEGSAITALLGWDAVFPASDVLHLIFGFNFRYFNFKWDNFDSFQVNVPAIYASARLQL
ncbi:MAG: hypothetical protein ACOH5I_11240 [Oligoflexus sp.]